MNFYNKLRYQIRDYKIHFNSTFYKYKKRRINAYWCRANNFGDWLTPVILNYFGYTVLYSSAYDADIIMVGSILEQVPSLYKGKIFGSGFLYSDSKLSLPNAEILSLRGHLTKNKMIISKEIVLGDPGLIISEIVRNRSKKYELGIIPHVTDTKTEILSILSKRSKIKVIYPQQHPFSVAKEVASCKAIISSSLHGLIFADSYGIPNRRIILNNNLLGGNFKFDDYYSVINCKETPIINITGKEPLSDLIEITTKKDEDRINTAKNNLYSLLESLTK